MRAITIKLKESLLLKQVAKTAYTIGENMGDDEAKMRHFIQSATDEGHIDLLRDRMDEAWSDILKSLMAYTILSPRYPCGAQEACTCTNWSDEPTTETVTNEDERVRYEITLYFPDNTFPNLGDRLLTWMQRFLVLNAKAEWQTITRQTHSIGRGYGQDYTITEKDAANILQKIKSIAGMRTTVGRVKPFSY